MKPDQAHPAMHSAGNWWVNAPTPASIQSFAQGAPLCKEIRTHDNTPMKHPIERSTRVPVATRLRIFVQTDRQQIVEHVLLLVASTRVPARDFDGPHPPPVAEASDYSTCAHLPSGQSHFQSPAYS